MTAVIDRLDERTPPMAGLAVAVAAVSTSAILVRWANAPGVVVAFYRVLLTLAIVAPLSVARHRRAFVRMGRRDALAAIGSGLALAVHFATWFESLAYTSVAASVTLVQTQPLFVAAGAWALLSERVTRGMVAGMVVALGGATMMTLADPATGTTVAPDPDLGNSLALAGAVAAAAYVLAGRSLRQRVSLLPYVTVVYAVCTVGLLAVVVGTGQTGALGPYPPREWGLFVAMAVGPGLFGHTVLNWALEHVESSVVSVSLLGEPVGSTLLAVPLLGEVPTPHTVVGGLVVLAGVYVTAAARSRSQADSSV